VRFARPNKLLLRSPSTHHWQHSRHSNPCVLSIMCTAPAPCGANVLLTSRSLCAHQSTSQRVPRGYCVHAERAPGCRRWTYCAAVGRVVDVLPCHAHERLNETLQMVKGNGVPEQCKQIRAEGTTEESSVERVVRRRGEMEGGKNCY
jgi:hypothetical protein